MILTSLISIVLVVPCFSLPESYRAPSTGGYANGFGGSLAKSGASGGFGLSFSGDNAGFNGIGRHGGDDGFSGELGAVGKGFSGKSYGKSVGPIIPILSDDREGPNEGHYRFKFESGNGISRQEEGAPNGPYGAVTQQGGWTFTFPDGTPAEFSFVADENGYRVESPLLPVPPPLPPHAIAQIEKAAKEAELGHQGGYSDSSFEDGVSAFNGGGPVSQHGSSRAFDLGRQAFQGQDQGKSYEY